ncbi:peroxiredoxin [Lanmaoa asiatica]|nr:peroxiredoxin [Lanmaoa asiatica]
MYLVPILSHNLETWPSLVGERIPEATFPYIPYAPELDDLTVSSYSIAKEWAGKKVVVFAVPGAFTPTCHVNHLPGYVKNYDQFKAQGIDVVAVIAANDPFVLSAWARVEGLKDKIVALSDVGAEWSKSIGLSIDLSARGLGIRTTRYAMIVEDMVVKQIKVEEVPSSVTVTGAEHLLALL